MYFSLHIQFLWLWISYFKKCHHQSEHKLLSLPCRLPPSWTGPYELFISWGCCNKLAQTSRPKITDIYYSSGSQKSKISTTWLKSKWWQGCAATRSSVEHTPCLFQLLVATVILWLVAVSLQSLPWWPHCLLLFNVCVIFPSASLLWGYMWLHLGNTQII